MCSSLSYYVAGELLTGTLCQPVLSRRPGSCLQNQKAPQQSLALFAKPDVRAQLLQNRLQGPGELAQLRSGARAT